MSEENAGENAPAGGEATAAAPQPPEWLGGDATKFWDGEKGEVRVQDIHKSFRELQSAFGARVTEMGPAARKALAEHAPEALRTTWEQELRAKLVEDPEFVTPLKEAWQAELPKPPEAYAVPDDMGDLDTEHPILTAAMETAKKHGLSQDAFRDVVGLGLELQKAMFPEVTEDMLKKEIGADYKERGERIRNRVVSLAGDLAGSILNHYNTPAQFLALERILKGTSEQPLVTDGSANPQQGKTRAELESDMRDPRYRTDPAFHAAVTAGFQRLYSDVV